MRTNRFGAIEIVSGAAGRVVDQDSGGVVPLWPCQCGGKYRLGFSQSGERGKPMLVHTLPHCARYQAVQDTDQAVAFSRENREALTS